VEEYKNIQKQGFNFSPRFTCDYNDKTNKLTIDKNDDYIENFFGDNINVTAIVGKNGSGKSNILEILFYKTKHRNKNKITFFIILFENKYYLYLFKSGELVLKKEINLDSSLDIKLIEDEIDVKNNNAKIKYDYLSIFYSNLHSEMPHSYNNKENSFINVSTSHLTQKNGSQSFSIKNVLDMLKRTNIELPFNIPNNLLINLNCKYFKDTENETSKKIGTLQLSLKDRGNTNFYNYLIAELIYRYSDAMKIKVEDIKRVSTFDELHTLFVNSKVNSTYLDELYQTTEIIRSLKITENSTIRFSIQSNTNNINEIVDLVNRLERILPSFDVFDFNFDIRMSTGEETFLFQFANIYNSLISKPAPFPNYPLNDSVILMDEGETTLHPQWQKKYLSWLVSFLLKNFSEQKFHLILTSHSPFLLSDIPKQNIIFLDTDEDGKCKVLKHDEVMNKKQTFGANIHTLLSDSFFMGNGLMGEFAKGKINKIIRFLNGENKFIDFPIEQIEKVIKTIGEPFLKSKLLDMYNRRFIDDYKIREEKRIDEQIRILEEEREKLND